MSKLSLHTKSVAGLAKTVKKTLIIAENKAYDTYPKTFLLNVLIISGVIQKLTCTHDLHFYINVPSSADNSHNISANITTTEPLDTHYRTTATSCILQILWLWESFRAVRDFEAIWKLKKNPSMLSGTPESISQSEPHSSERCKQINTQRVYKKRLLER